MQFVNNFRVALNPQIIKSYAAGEIEEFKRWSLRSTVIASDLLLVLGLPCIVTMKTILSLWLVDVPPLAVEFTQLAIVSQIIGSISSSTYIPFVASGKLRNNAIWGAITGFGYFVVLYAIYRLGGVVLWVQWLYLILMLVSVFCLRPWLLHKEVGFTYKEIFNCLLDCFKPIVFAGAVSYLLMTVLGDTLWQQGILFLLVFVEACGVVWLFLERDMRDYIISTVKAKIKRGI